MYYFSFTVARLTKQKSIFKNIHVYEASRVMRANKKATTINRGTKPLEKRIVLLVLCIEYLVFSIEY